MRTVWLGATMGLTLLAACSFAPLDLSDRECPCVSGYSCVAGRCVVESDLGMDAAVDAPVVDAPASDMPVDGGVDAPAIDAPASDMPIDGGSDAGLDGGPCHTQTLPLLGPDDDGQWDATDLTTGNWYATGGGGGSTLDCGAWAAPDAGVMGHYPTWCYFRFRLSADVPASATLTSSVLTLISSGDLMWTALDPSDRGLFVYLDTLSAASAISSGSQAAAHTAALGSPASWPATGPLAWPATGPVPSNDLSAIFEPRHTAGTLGTGSYVQLWVRSWNSNQEAYVSTPVFVAGTTATLTIQWCD